MRRQKLAGIIPKNNNNNNTLNITKEQFKDDGEGLNITWEKDKENHGQNRGQNNNKYNV